MMSHCHIGVANELYNCRSDKNDSLFGNSSWHNGILAILERSGQHMPGHSVSFGAQLHDLALLHDTMPDLISVGDRARGSSSATNIGFQTLGLRNIEELILITAEY
eukprot:gb/GECG01001780.1/.p1 GENE.gb/GECG01001780.1/~~gb/GECG01001780.1/.p1  ORF type:complete len:106 (+),score=7.22 gb/GECG01001780.1/:1-318(+)